MRKLGETELYSAYMKDSQKNELQNAINTKLNQNVGVIAPEHIEAELTQLKIKSKKSYYPLLSEAISLFEQFNGRVRLFDLGATAAGRSPIPPFMPFLSANARNKQLESDSSSRGVSPAIYVNMYRIGMWSADESQYTGARAVTDLYASLESGLIAYKLLVENKSEKVFSNSVVLENLTRIYTSLFSSAVIRTMVNYGNDFNTDAARFLIAKFFLLYVLKKSESETVDSFAYESISYRTSLPALKNFESISNIIYDSLSGFLKSLGLAFFNKPIDLASFEKNYLSMYGEGLVFAIEYVPYLLHFLFSSYHGAPLGGSTKLYNRLPDLQKDGLLKLYNAVISELR
jgi:hypothetical protein